MAKINVKPDMRVWKRLLNQGFKKSVTKSIAELVTNSDDSYKEKFKKENGIEYPSNPIFDFALKLNIGDMLDPKHIVMPEEKFKKEKIVIKCFRSRSPKMHVIDFAEGMNYEEMNTRFEKFGKDQGRFVSGRRGLFGQGLMQVLFSHRKGNLFSIKEDVAAKAIFAIGGKGRDGELEIKTDDIGHKHLKEMRHSYGLPSGNGTFVEFILDEECVMPQRQQLESKLNNFYIMRSLNTDPLREVVLEQHKGADCQRIQLKYAFPIGEVIFKGNIAFKFETYPEITGELIIMRHEAPLIQNDTEDRQGGLLVIDEKDAIYDLTFFEYERNPYIDRLFGILKLNGTRKIIKDKLDRGEAILTDSRDGFDEHHPFYKALNNAVSPLLKQVLDKEAEARKAEQAELSPEMQKRHREAFDELNKLYEELTGEKPNIGPDPTPTKIPDYINFDRESIRITVGKSSRAYLFVNASKVENKQTITISSSNPQINVSPKEIVVDMRSQKDGVLTYSIITESIDEGCVGDIVAQTKGMAGEGKASISAVVVPPYFYVPADSLEFNPKYSATTPEKAGTLNLFLNTEKIPTGSQIVLSSSNDEVRLDISKFDLDTHLLIKGTKIAQKKINFRGLGIGQRSVIKAQYKDSRGNIFFDEAEVAIVSQKKKTPPPGGGRFSKAVYQPLDRPVQSLFNPDNGEVIVNSNHPINKKYFGQDAVEYKKAVETLLHSQILLAELVLSECLFEAVSKAYHGGKITGTGDPATDIRKRSEEIKFSMGDRIHKHFVTVYH